MARMLVGEENVVTDGTPGTGSEDFAFLLQERPGCYLAIGNGEGPAACTVHEPTYDFNDEILPIGASFFARLVERVLCP